MCRSHGTPWLRLCGLFVFGIAGAQTEGNRTALTLCHYQENGVTKQCELFRKLKCQNISYEPENYGAYELKEGEEDGQPYNNVTFFALSHGNGFFGINGTEECWQFEVGSTPYPEKYIIMDLEFFPDISRETIQIYRDGGRCGYLYSSSYSFQVYSVEGAKLAFTFQPVSGVREVELNLIGGDCEINCDGNSNNCSIPLDSDTMKDFAKPRYFDGLRYRYYCIRVLHGACATHTETIKNEDPPPPPTPRPSEESVQTTVILLTTGTIVAVILVAVFVKKRYCDDPFRPEPVDTKDPEPSTPWSSSPVLQKVLLLYSRDCPQFCAVVRALGQLLQTFGNLKVLDPMQQNEMEQVSENISGWLTQHLQSPDVKLVIVVSEGAMVRQNALLNNHLVHNDEPHFLDPLFTLALQQMHERPQLGNDYKRIFPVRFEDFTPSEISLSLIVPLKCYVLQRHLGKLIAELRHCNSALETSYEDIQSIRPQEVNQLESAIRDMKSYCTDNPHYVKNHFSFVIHK